MDLELKFGEQLALSYVYQKKMMNFLDYPNDVARGFNVWHMPIWYEMTSSSG
jgi:hypothetical protein